MAWRKLGRIFAPSGELDWSRSHAALPVPEWIEGDIFRIYFSGRDGQNRSSIGSVIVDLAVGGKILDIPAEPILRPGARGMFDDCGVSIGSIVRAGDTRLLYYTGWNLAVTVPWKNTMAWRLAKQVHHSSDGLLFPSLRWTSVIHSRFLIPGSSKMEGHTVCGMAQI